MQRIVVDQKVSEEFRKAGAMAEVYDPAGNLIGYFRVRAVPPEVVELPENSVAALASHLTGQPHVVAAYLLGSAAAERLRPDSDVDIAVLPRFPDGISLAERLSLAAELGRLVGREVDLGVLTTRNLVYAKEAVSRGRLIFDRDHAATARFEMYALSMYASLQEARREVLAAYVP
jgi:predicted nucleotidyltransferase